MRLLLLLFLLPLLLVADGQRTRNQVDFFDDEGMKLATGMRT